MYIKERSPESLNPNHTVKWLADLTSQKNRIRWLNSSCAVYRNYKKNSFGSRIEICVHCSS